MLCQVGLQRSPPQTHTNYSSSCELRHQNKNPTRRWSTQLPRELEHSPPLKGHWQSFDETLTFGTHLSEDLG